MATLRRIQSYGKEEDFVVHHKQLAANSFNLRTTNIHSSLLLTREYSRKRNRNGKTYRFDISSTKVKSRGIQAQNFDKRFTVRAPQHRDGKINTMENSKRKQKNKYMNRTE